jgi:general secretion pathway protein F
LGAFEYTAVDNSGRQQKGVLEGDTARQVRQLLRERGLLPMEVSEVVERDSTGISFSFRRGISAADLALTTRQLATLVRSGMPLEEALLAVGQQAEKPRLKSILLGVRSRVMEGHSLADGLGEFPHAFPEIYRATVAAGEQSGHLDPVLERLADYTESRQQLRQRVSHALIYPVILTVLAVLIVSGLLVYVVPKVVGVFENTGQALPLFTRMLIASLPADAPAAGFPPPLASLPAPPAGGRPPGPGHQHRPVHPDPVHPRRQRRPGPGSAADRRGRGRQPADA